jgi:hypothetical protein
MTRKAYERTPIDKEEDRKGARNAGVSVKKYEGSKAVMKPLTNAKHEAFAQALASGKTQIEAHALAGFKPHRGNASSLAQDKNIVERVQFLLNERERITAQSTAKAIEKAALTKEWVIEQLIENVKRASTAEPVRDGEGNPIGDYAYQGTVVNRALELLGKESPRTPIYGRQSVGKNNRRIVRGRYSRHWIISKLVGGSQMGEADSRLGVWRYE